MSGFELAAAVLPGEIRRRALALSDQEKGFAQEFRLRLGRAPTVLCQDRERVFFDGLVRREDLLRLLEIATGASPYAAGESIQKGYITAAGGVRIGLCGIRDLHFGCDWTSGGITSASVRIPGEVRGCGEKLCSLPLVSTLIISPPGQGKTTLLRDMVRCYSRLGVRMGLCDERGEIAALNACGSGFDVGPYTDVLTACSKTFAALQLLRTMNPQMIAMDEITEQEDAEACRIIAGSGVALLATLHGDIEPADPNKTIRSLTKDSVFHRIIYIKRDKGRWIYMESKC